MSGQPTNTVQEVDSIRQQYLANLNLRASLDDMNYQANKTYKRTGQLPAEMTDFRSVSEKLADIERLKIDIRSKLLTITDGREAEKISNILSPDQIQFLAQNFDPIADNMKKLYKVGVVADIFIDYLNRYMDKFNQTRGVELGLQQSRGNDIIANQEVILRNMMTKQNFQSIRDLLKNVKVSGARNENYLDALNQRLSDLQAVVNNIPDMLGVINSKPDAITRQDLLQTMGDITRDLPTTVQVQQLLEQVRRTIKGDNESESLKVLGYIDEMLTPVDEVLTEILDNFNVGINPVPQKAGLKEPSVESSLLKAGVSPFAKSLEVKSVGSYQPEPIIEDDKVIEFIKNTGFRSFDKELNLKMGRIPPLYPETNPVKKDYIRQVYVKNGLKTKLGVELAGWAKRTAGDYINNSNEEQLNTLIKTINKILFESNFKDGDAPSVLGQGVMRKFGCGVYHNPEPVGIKASPKYIDLGRFIINKSQLNKGIVSIRRPKGTNIIAFPSKRVSKNLTNVFKKIIGGSIPSFDELNELDDEERVYLNKVVKEARIEDKLSIPSPSKDAEEKDINQFEILRGQILAGNDNPDVVKKFKLIILKLGHKGLLPSGQIKDILMDLITLGY